MTIKTILFSVCSLLCINQAVAQRRQNVYFFKNSGLEVKVRDSADYIREVSEPDSGSKLYNVNEFYLNKKPKLIGKSSNKEVLLLEGQAITFYPSGIKQIEATYSRGFKVGDVYEYYPNGKLYTHKQYLPPSPNLYKTFDEKFLIIDCLDSTGKQLVVNGNGYYTGFDNEFKNIDEEGNLKSGLRDGKWKGHYKGQALNVSFKEEYNNGELLSGESADETGTVHKYSIRETQPHFKGGADAFGKFLARSISYPRGARSRNAQGKVFIGFVVEKDGTLSDYKILVNPDDELSAEAIRVLKQSPKWIAGQQYGIPVRAIYSVPVSFYLGYNIGYN